jgi:hypothetical protein
VNDDRVDAGLLEKRDIRGERLAEFGVAHGVAAVFHDDRLVFVTLHIGQRLCQKLGLKFAFGSRHRIPLNDKWGLLAHVSDRGNNQSARLSLNRRVGAG